MPRDPRILHLYEKSFYGRRPLAPPPAGPSLGDTILACAAITLATAIFFWTYDALMHRDPIFVPSLQQAWQTRNLAAPEVPIPNMQSPEIIRANADVSVKKPDVAKPVKQAEVPPRKKRVQTVKPLPREATDAYASAPPMLPAAPFGGW
jgi:hypothetical protein